jgi:outer membrane receptor protein involved in Fe transport
MRLLSIALLLLLAIGAASPALSADPSAAEGGERAEAPDESEIEITDSAASVTSALQGKEGVRIQTLCTHCNSANVQVGGLAADLAPIFLDDYPVLGGLAVSMLFGVLPADTVVDAEVAKGPGAGDTPASAAGGVIRLTESTPEELPTLDYSGELGSWDRAKATLRVAGPLGQRVSASLVAGKEQVDPVDGDDDGINDIGALDRGFTEARIKVEAGRDHALDFGFSWIDEEATDGRGKYDLIADLFDLADQPTWVREDTLLDRREYRAGWVWKLGKGRRLDVRLLADDREQTLRDQETRYDVPGFSTELEDRLIIDEENLWGSIRYRNPIGLKGMVAVGFETRDQDVTAYEVIPFVGGFNEYVDMVDDWAGFANLEYKLAARVDVEVGLQYADARWGAVELGDYREKNRALPRATVRFRPASGWTLKLIAGETLRIPRPIFTEVCCGNKPVRNVNTAAETSLVVGFEGTYQPSPDLRMSLYAARAEFDDYILRLVGRSEFYQSFPALVNVPETRADTLEMAVRWSPLERLTLDGSIGWLSHDNEGDTEVVVDLSSLVPPEILTLPIDQIPYQPDSSGSLGATLTLPWEIELSGQASYTGSMLIQQADEDLFAFPLLLDEMRETEGFWMVNFAFRAPLTENFELIAGVDNVTDRVQNDMDDPTTDYNWGPLAGRSWRAGLRMTFGGS